MATYGETRTVGAATLQVVWPPADPARLATEGSLANNASVVLLVDVAGLRLLLTGDVEPEAQAALARTLPGLRGRRAQAPAPRQPAPGPGFLTGLRPRVVLVPVGEDNDYGHPAPSALAPFEAAGADVLRTDRDGDLVVVVRDGSLLTATRD